MVAAQDGSRSSSPCNQADACLHDVRGGDGDNASDGGCSSSSELVQLFGPCEDSAEPARCTFLSESLQPVKRWLGPCEDSAEPARGILQPESCAREDDTAKSDSHAQEDVVKPESDAQEDVAARSDGHAREDVVKPESNAQEGGAARSDSHAQESAASLNGCTQEQASPPHGVHRPARPRRSPNRRSDASRGIVADTCPAHLALPTQHGARLRWAGLGLLDEELPSSSALPALGIKLDIVRDLDLSSNKLVGAFMPRLLSPCRRLVALRAVRLFNNALGDSSAAFLAQMCVHCPMLIEMHLSHNLLTARGVREIVPSACRGSAQRRTLLAARKAGESLRLLPPFWLRLEHNSVSDPGFLMDEWKAAGLLVCGRHRGCSSTSCQFGMDVHLPYFRSQGGGVPGHEQSDWQPQHSAAMLTRAVASQSLGGYPSSQASGYGAAAQVQTGYFGGHSCTRGQSLEQGANPDARCWKGRPRSHSRNRRTTNLQRSWHAEGNYLQAHPKPGSIPTEPQHLPQYSRQQQQRRSWKAQHTDHAGSFGLLREKPAFEPATASAPEANRVAVQVPHAAAFLLESQLACIASGAQGFPDLPGLQYLREQHKMCHIELEFAAEAGGRARPVLIVRQATGVDHQAGPVAASIAMEKAVRDVESLVESLVPQPHRRQHSPSRRGARDAHHRGTDHWHRIGGPVH